MCKQTYDLTNCAVVQIFGSICREEFALEYARWEFCAAFQSYVIYKLKISMQKKKKNESFRIKTKHTLKSTE